MATQAYDPFQQSSGFQSPWGSSLPTQYDSNGYVNYLGIPDYGTNPWNSVVGQTQGNVNNALTSAGQIPGMQQGIAQDQNQMAAYAQATAYPTFQNSAGIGSGQPVTGGTQQAANPDTSSRGFNPWSLQGEALSR